MKNRKLSVRTAHFLGQTIVNGGVILIMFGVWILSFVLVLKANLSVWFIFIGIFAGPLIAWMWWSYSIPRWRYWTRQHLNEEEIEELHQLSINSQLEWQRGHVLEKTEIRSSEYRQQDLSIAISSIEIFLNQRVPESVHDIKVAFPDLDTSVLDEIRGFVFNLKAMTSPTGDISNLSASLDRLDELIHRLIGTTNTVKGRQGDVVDGWFYMVVELSNRLTKLRMVVKSYFSTGKDETESRKTSPRQFLVNLLGALIIYGGAILVMIGVWALSIFVMRKADLSDDYSTIVFAAGLLAGVFWHSFSSTRWKLWLRRYLPVTEKTLKHQDLGDIIQSTENFLSAEAPMFIREFKTAFPDFDTSAIDEIEKFVINLKTTFAKTGAMTGHYINSDEVDQLIKRLHKDTDTLKGRQWGEVREWLYVVSGLTERLTQLKAVLNPTKK